MRPQPACDLRSRQAACARVRSLTAPDDPSDGAGSIVRRMRFVRSGGYDVCHTSEGIAEVADLLVHALRDRRALVVTTPTVNQRVTKPLLDRCAVRLGRTVPALVLSCSELQKTQETVAVICAAALDADLDRTAVLVAVGGGVCSDLTTMAAASIRRGLSQIRVPTTLVGQVDAGIGVKGALNFAERKSYLGCYFPPELVLVNQGFLAGLPIRHFRAGLAEIVKMAIVADDELFWLLEREPLLTPEHFASHAGNSRSIVWRSIVSLLNQLEPNLFEDQTHERLADFGHTFSPIVESESRFEVLHGEAVAIDIALSTELASCMGILSDQARDRIVSLLRRLALPTFSACLTLPQCVRSMEAARNHRGGRVNLILPSDIGGGRCIAERAAVPDTALRAALERLARDAAVS
jgi:3-dehydroquinate synthetase